MYVIYTFIDLYLPWDCTYSRKKYILPHQNVILQPQTVMTHHARFIYFHGMICLCLCVGDLTYTRKGTIPLSLFVIHVLLTTIVNNPVR